MRTKGFTLVEMMVVAPIVILIIGGFIGLIVNLTGEVMSSRGANMLTYNVQDALNRIEEDVKLSSTYLAVNSIDQSNMATTTKQGYGGTTTAGSMVNFTNIDKTGSGGSPASLILNTLATNANPLSTTSQFIYLKDQPNDCSNVQTYSKNRPLSINIVYFVDSSNTLWRRVLMPSTYASTANYCGGIAPWQVPTCINGYVPTSLPFCKSNDEKMIEGVTPANFSLSYYSIASSTSPDPTATNSGSSDSARATAMLATPTVGVTITANQTVAGRAITKTSSLRATRLDANASGIAQDVAVTTAPSAPSPSGIVSNGHVVTFTWPQVSGATSYEARSNINGGTWTSWTTGISNTTRSRVVSTGTHTDTINIEVLARNSFGPSTTTATSITIPLWAPLVLQNGWTDYGSYNPAGYTKTKSGLVMFRGLIKNAGTPVANDIIASLPSDYQPTDRLIFENTTYSNTNGRVDVDGGGNVLFYTGSGTWFSLETVRYLPSSASYTLTAPTLLNSWVNYGGVFAPATHTQDSTGRVVIQGLIKSGTNTNGTDMFTIPAGLAPPQYMNVTVMSSGTASAYLGITTTAPAVEARAQGSNGYVSLNTTYMPASASVTWSNLTLKNSWVNYGSIYTTAQYTKASDNVVHLKGFVKSGTTTQGTIVGTLPSGFLPKNRILYSTSVNAEFTRIDIDKNGDIIFYGGNNTWLSLDGISFVADG